MQVKLLKISEETNSWAVAANFIFPFCITMCLGILLTNQMPLHHTVQALQNEGFLKQRTTVSLNKTKETE